MKKFYLTLLLSLPFAIYAQTITQADLPTVGTSYTLGVNPAYTGPIPSQGLNQTWDFSALQNIEQDTAIFGSPAGTPYSDDFQFSNVVSYNTSDDSYVYFSNLGSGFYVDGVGSPGLILTYQPPLLFVPVPFSYGANDVISTARIQKDTTIVDTATTNLRIVIYYELEFKAYATGTLTTPTSVYTDVLGVKVFETRYDSVYYDIGGGIYFPISDKATQSTHYRYFKSGSTANYLLGIDVDSAGTPKRSEFLVESGVAVPKVVANKKMNTYPNPAFNDINFKNLTSNTGIVVFDNNGKEVLRAKQINNSRLNVETLKNGVYHFEIDQNGTIQKGSFVIQH